ncbi:PilW family protein [Vibrio hepatarius]|uniref:PilW family protein n=1 Tax=Vibrio hepatarius TaxID=171383 RepID=UPI003734CD0E
MNRSGFTLIEMVVTLIVGSVLVIGIAGFVELGARGYVDTVDRQRLQTQAKFVVEKLTREVRHAVPNVFTSENNCIAFYPITYSGFYQINGADIDFIVGQDTPVGVAELQDLSMIINPTSTLANANNFFGFNELIDDGNLVDEDTHFEMLGQATRLVGGSIANRQYIFDADNGEVEYCVTNGRVERNRQRLTDGLADDFEVSGTLTYLPVSVQMNGVVRLNLTFTQNEEVTNFQQDVQVLNVP